MLFCYLLFSAIVVPTAAGWIWLIILMTQHNRKQKLRERNSGYRKHITQNRKEF